jgi:fluoroquinolone transport system permease protein
MLTQFFALTDWNFLILSEASLLMSFLTVGVALFIFSFSRNKVEGMAMAKLSGLMLIGLAVPFFIFSDVQYFAAFLGGEALHRRKRYAFASWTRAFPCLVRDNRSKV